MALLRRSPGRLPPMPVKASNLRTPGTMRGLVKVAALPGATMRLPAESLMPEADTVRAAPSAMAEVVSRTVRALTAVAAETVTPDTV